MNIKSRITKIENKTKDILPPEMLEGCNQIWTDFRKHCPEAEIKLLVSKDGRLIEQPMEEPHGGSIELKKFYGQRAFSLVMHVLADKNAWQSGKLWVKVEAEPELSSLRELTLAFEKKIKKAA